MPQPGFDPHTLTGEFDRLFLTPARSCAALTSSYAEALTQYQLKTLSTYVDIAGKAHRAALGTRNPDDVQRSVQDLADIGQELRGQVRTDTETMIHLNRSFTDTLEKFAQGTYQGFASRTG